MLVQFENSWIQKIPLTPILDSAVILAVLGFFFIQLFPTGQHVVLLNIQTRLSSDLNNNEIKQDVNIINLITNLIIIIIIIITTTTLYYNCSSFLGKMSVRRTYLTIISARHVCVTDVSRVLDIIFTRFTHNKDCHMLS